MYESSVTHILYNLEQRIHIVDRLNQFFIRITIKRLIKAWKPSGSNGCFHEDQQHGYTKQNWDTEQTSNSQQNKLEVEPGVNVI